LLEVLLALSILSIGLTTLLIARNRSIVRLRFASWETGLRSAAEAALAAETLALICPDGQTESVPVDSDELMVSVDLTSDEFGEGIVLHRLSATASFRDDRDVPPFTIATATLETAEIEEDARE